MSFWLPVYAVWLDHTIFCVSFYFYCYLAVIFTVELTIWNQIAQNRCQNLC